MTYPSMDDLRRAGTEAHLRPIQRRIDALVAALPWHGRLLCRIALPIARVMNRAERAEARIKAVQDALDADEHVTKHMGTLGQFRPDVPAIAHDAIRRALDGDA